MAFMTLSKGVFMDFCLEYYFPSAELHQPAAHTHLYTVKKKTPSFYSAQFIFR
jgi:hypothetical protein